MAHEVEQMLYVGDTPWHGLGVALNEPPTVEEAIKIAGLDWSVRCDPVYRKAQTKAPAGTSYEEVSAQVTIRESDESVLGVVGPSYTPLQNKESFDWFQPFIDNKLASLNTAGSLRDGQRVWVLAKLNKPNSKIIKGDEVEKFILLSNGHDGKLAARVGFTPIRVVCSNTMAFAHSDGRSQLIRVRHTANIKETFDNLRDIMNTVNEEFEATADQYRLLARKDISAKDLEKYIKVVFKLKPKRGEVIDLSEVSLEENEMKRTFNKIIPLFEGGRGTNIKGVRGTWWGAYNAVSEFLTWEKGSSQDGRINNLWYDGASRTNNLALSAALKMAV